MRINKVVNEKKGRHVPPYGFFLNKVFEFFQVGLCKEITSSRNHMFTISTLEECELVNEKGGVRSHSVVFDLMTAQERSNKEMDHINSLLCQRDDDTIPIPSKPHPSPSKPLTRRQA